MWRCGPSAALLVLSCLSGPVWGQNGTDQTLPGYASAETGSADSDRVSLVVELNHRAETLWRAGNSKDAEPLLAEALKRLRTIQGGRHPAMLMILGNYAAVLRSLGRTAEAEPLFADATQLARELWGLQDPDTLTLLDKYATVLDANGRSAKAAPLYAEVLQARRELLGDEHPDTMTSISNYADILDKLDRSREAEPLYAEALNLRRKALGDRHPATLRSLSNYAFILDALGRSDEAAPLFAEVLKLRREVLGNRHPDTQNSIRNYAATLNQLGRLSEAEPLYAEALRLRRETLGDHDPNTIYSLDTYSSVLRLLGRLADAEPLGAEALRLRREALGNRHPDTLKSVNNYALILNAMGRYGDAEPFLRETLKLRREILGESHPDTISSLNNYAFVLEELGRPREAEPIYAEALQRAHNKLGDRDPITLSSMSNYAGVLDALGRAREAEPLYGEVLRLRRETLGDRHPDTLGSLNNYAYALSALGRAAEAEPLYAEALRLSRASLGDRHPATLTSLSNYAWILKQLGRPASAEPLDAEALRLRREMLGARHPDTLTSLINYAFTLNAVGRSVEAEPLFREALQLSREILGDRHPTSLTSLNNYAAIQQILGRKNKAEPLYAEALKLRREVLGERHPDTLDSLYSYAVILAKQGNYREALPVIRERVTLSRQRIADVGDNSMAGAVQSEREQIDARAPERWLAHILWRNAEGRPASDARSEAFVALQRASAGAASQAVAESAARRYAGERGMQAIAEERQALSREWAAVETSLVKISIQGADGRAEQGRMRERLAQIETRTHAIDFELQQQAPQYFAILKQPELKLVELQALLDPDEAALLLVPGENGTDVMAITGESLTWWEIVSDRIAIASQVQSLRAGLEVQGNAVPSFDLEGAHRLYELLIAPVMPTLKGKKRLYIVADGALSRLPFGVLVGTRPPANADRDDPAVLRATDWFADRFALVQLPSLQSLAYIRTYRAGQGEASQSMFRGFGDPVLGGAAQVRGARGGAMVPVEAVSLTGSYDAADSRQLMNTQALRKLAGLPGTKVELEQVRAALGAPSASLFLEERMTESAVRSMDLSGVAVLHFATHGLTSKESGDLAEPGLVFTPPGEASAADDGYLAASEVVGLNLNAARFVILSACNTAAPAGGAEESGLSGLARAFFYSGAQSLLVSHWPVFDDVAAKLTVDTIARARNGQSRAEALQAAMRSLRNDPELDAAAPAVWAPFILVGEGR